MTDAKHQQDQAKAEEKKMRMLTIYIPQEIIDIYDVFASEGFIPNRSEGFRMAITDYLFKLLSARSAVKDLDEKLRVLKPLDVKGNENP